jgi:hypothetical protein
MMTQREAPETALAEALARIRYGCDDWRILGDRLGLKFMIRARVILAELDAAGIALVPKHPDRKMQIAGMDALDVVFNKFPGAEDVLHCNGVWAPMLAASPYSKGPE